MKKILSLLLAVVLLFSFPCGCTNEEKAPINLQSIQREDAGLILHFIDVGQGDCTLIESNGHFALIDAGERIEEDNVISYLSSVGVKTLDFIISTHPHSDHCGALPDVIRYFKPTTLICPDVSTDSNVWTSVLDAADEIGVDYDTPEPYDVYKIGSTTLTVLSPSTDAVYSDLNDYSIVCMVEYGNVSALLTGDAERVVERELVRSGFDLSADILKCGHHGSSTSSCPEFLKAVDPAVAIISCGKDNEYGHPHTETISSLDSRSISYWRTDIQGDIVVATEGEQIYVSTSESEIIVTDPTATQSKIHSYVGNKNSKVFHFATCESVSVMKEKNKVFFDSLDEAVGAGYSPCENCNP